MNRKLPILLITGFLGSGKTTFINWLIGALPSTKISLILNEFGTVALESQFIKSHSGEVAELANGCMCCIAKSDIPRVINYILDKSPQTEYLVIEASGLSDPDPIRDALTDPRVADKVQLASVICLVDAVNFEKTRNDHAIVMSQVGDADTVLVSKIGEAGANTTERVAAFVKSIGINTRVVLWGEKLVPEQFLSSSRSAVPKEAPHEHSHEHYDERWYESDMAIDEGKLQEVLASLPKNIVRAKGVVKTSNGKRLLQFVNGKFSLEKSEWKPSEDQITNILFLGKELDWNKISASLRAAEIS